MVRLWNRGAGLFRALAIGVLVLGLIGGIFVAKHETGDDNKTSTTAALDNDADHKDDDDVRRLASDLTEHKSAQSKAEEVATKDAEQAQAAEEQARKSQAANRSQSRSSTTSTKPGVEAGPAPASCSEYSGNKAIGCTLLLQVGFGLDQMPCLAKLWDRESGWRTTAANGSGAYGIPQSLPGSKMAAYGDDWRTNPATQISWGLNYIKTRYSTPCGAWSHFQSANSY